MQGHLEIAIAQTHASGVFPTPDRPIKNKLFVLNVFHQGMKGRSHILTESLRTRKSILLLQSCFIFPRMWSGILP